MLPALGVGELYLVSWGERAAALTGHARQSSRAPACPGRGRDGRLPDGAAQGGGGNLDAGERMVKIAGRQHAVDLP